jgi:hypothetical protein
MYQTITKLKNSNKSSTTHGNGLLKKLVLIEQKLKISKEITRKWDRTDVSST